MLRKPGTGNFVAKFTPHVSNFTEPLRELTKKNTGFHWLESHDKAFENLKKLLSGPETLRYYNVINSVTLQVDSSMKGLETTLTKAQLLMPVKRSTKLSKDGRKKEKELFAIVFSCLRFPLVEYNTIQYNRLYLRRVTRLTQ